MKTFGKTYLTIGIMSAIVSATVLIKDGKDSPSKIAYYTALNGVVWPMAIVAGAQKHLSKS